MNGAVGPGAMDETTLPTITALAHAPEGAVLGVEWLQQAVEYVKRSGLWVLRGDADGIPSDRMHRDLLRWPCWNVSLMAVP